MPKMPFSPPQRPSKRPLGAVVVYRCVAARGAEPGGNWHPTPPGASPRGAPACPCAWRKIPVRRFAPHRPRARRRKKWTAAGTACLGTESIAFVLPGQRGENQVTLQWELLGAPVKYHDSRPRPHHDCRRAADASRHAAREADAGLIRSLLVPVRHGLAVPIRLRAIRRRPSRIAGSYRIMVRNREWCAIPGEKRFQIALGG
jgi:hypothetical protein